jgi:hypothetical protein
MRWRPDIPYAVLGVLVILGTAGAASVLQPGQFGTTDFAQAVDYIAWSGVVAVGYVTAIWLARFRPAPRTAVPLILAVGLVARLLMLVTPPIQSTDLYRYVWDGRVQAAGINPYRYVPVDPALAPLRDDGTGPSAIFPNINRADTARTIYPPAAQMLFALVGVAAPSVWGIKAAMLGFDVLTTAIVLLMLRAAARPAVQVVIWAWNPLVIMEFSGGGHIDAMAAAFTALALLMAIRSRRGWAGLALGIAIATKFLPAVVAPAIWRRWDWKTPLVVLATVLVGYAVYASAGAYVLGYLGGYASEENLGDGNGFELIRLLSRLGPVPGWAPKAYDIAGLVFLAGVTLWIVRGPMPVGRPGRATVIGRGAMALTAALIFILSPHYPWYLTMLVVPSVLCPVWGAVWLTVAAPLLYLDYDRVANNYAAWIYVPAFALLLFDLRSRRAAPDPALLANGGS